MVDRPGHRRDHAEAARCGARELGRLDTGSDRLDPANLRLSTDERRDLARIAAEHRHVHETEDAVRGRRTVFRRTRTDGIEHHRDLPRGRSTAREQHRLDPVRRQRADVEDERRRDARHLLDLFTGVRHHRQCAERQRRVRRLVHDDVVRDLVYERLLLAQRAQRRSRRAHRVFTPNTSTGPSPEPISVSPCATARDAAAAAPRAASARLSPRASRAVSVAECVQPAPCVAATSCRSTGISMCVAAVEEMVDRVVAVPAGDDCGPRAQLVEPLRQRTTRRVETCERPGLEQVRRHDRRERKQPPEKCLDRIVLEQLRARARDHDGIDDERHRVLLEIVRDCFDQGAREEHARLRGIDADVAEHRVELPAHERRRQLVDRAHADGALRGQGHEHRRSVRACRSKCLQIRLDARAAARVGRRDRQRAWNAQKRLPSPVLTGSGSTGLLSAASAAPRCRQANTPSFRRCGSSPFWASSESGMRRPSSTGRRS